MANCIVCGEKMVTRRKTKKFCSDRCKLKFNYTAKSISIGEPIENDPRYDWHFAETWAVEFNTPKDWIARAIQACREADVEISYVRKRYLEKDGTPKNPIVDEVFRELFHKAGRF